MARREEEGNPVQAVFHEEFGISSYELADDQQDVDEDWCERKRRR